MANNSVKKFVCTFENGLHAVMGATSKADAMEAAKAMQRTANSKIIAIEELIEEEPYLDGYIDQAFTDPQLPDGNEQEEDVGIDF